MLDLLGLDAEKALEVLSGKGLSWETVITEPPRKSLDTGCLKVIKQELIEGAYRLTLCKVPDDFR
ncbi:MAG: hypothetical protein ACOX4J_07200 [Anaerovoracaceae bacterium]|jgi:hypothetical protein